MIFIRPIRLRFAFAGTLLIASNTLASGPSGLPPIITERSPETVIVNLNLGQTSFLCTGTAIDLDPGDTVYIFSAPLPAFMKLDVMNGNPATFRLHAENLTLANYGGYFVDVLASDTLTGPAGDSARFHISVIPEPSTFGLFILFAPIVRRTR